MIRLGPQITTSSKTNMFHHSLIETIGMTKDFTKKQLLPKEFDHVYQLLNNRCLFRNNIRILLWDIQIDYTTEC
jgi:hypothetical protein